MSRAGATVLFLLVALTAHWAEARSLHLCRDEIDLPPWQMKNNTGLNISLLKEVGQKIGVSFEIAPMPWRRCLAMVQAGRIEGAIGVDFRPERLDMAAFPERHGVVPDPQLRISTQTFALYKLKDENLHWDGATLGGDARPIAAQQGHSVVPFLRSMSITVDDYERDPEQMLRKLLMGSVAAVALVESVGDELLRQPKYAERIHKMQPMLLRKESYLIFSHQFAQNNSAFTMQVWETIARVRNSTGFRKQLQQMGIVDALP